MNLYEATRYLHHSAEKHPFAKSMIDGTISKQNWCDWLNALQQIHYAIDPYVPDYAKRTHSLNHDLILMLPVTPINYESTKNIFPN
jgi:thiaminase